MNPKRNPSAAASVFKEEDLLALELRIARRADRLFEQEGSQPGRDLEHWLRAEREVIGGSDISEFAAETV